MACKVRSTNFDPSNGWVARGKGDGRRSNIGVTNIGVQISGSDHNIQCATGAPQMGLDHDTRL